MLTRRLSLALLTIVALPALSFAQSGAPTRQQTTPPAATAQAPAPNQNQQMMHQKMMSEMAAMDQKLDTMVAQMNAAQGQAKVDAMAAVINELINQRKQMREQMADMMGQRTMTGGGMMGQGGMMGSQNQPGMTMGTSGGMMAGAAAATFDPVCRARIADNTAPTATYRGKTYRFCSEADKRAFLKNPARYLGAQR